MKKSFFVLLFLVCSLSVYSQSTTSVNFNIDQYDWNKLIVSHYFDKVNGISAQFWFKQPTDVKRLRVYYQRKFAHSEGKNTEQLIIGGGFQVTSRKRRSTAFQFVIPADLQFRHKLNKAWTFNTRFADFLSISPNARQGDHTNKFITEAGFKYHKTNMYYHAEYLTAFKTGLKESFQGVAVTYDFTKKITLGVLPYTDFKQRDKTLHFAFIANFKL